MLGNFQNDTSGYIVNLILLVKNLKIFIFKFETVGIILKILQIKLGDFIVFVINKKMYTIAIDLDMARPVFWKTKFDDN